jgi:CheY-like chemotaxis protein
MNKELETLRHQQLTALVIDDDAFSRKLTCCMLRKLGIATILEASSGEAGLAILAANPPNFVILDWIMPGMSGLETLQQVTAVPEFRKIPVVVTSESASRDAIVQTARAGASAVVIRPFATATLGARILRATGENRPESPTGDGDDGSTHKRRQA